MSEEHPTVGKPAFDFKDATRFWEPQRLWYNTLLVAAVVLWIALTWPHFRPTMNLLALGKMTVLALLANLCYCAGYVAEAFIQPLVQQTSRRRLRWAVWIAGMLLSLLLENYWIADEIYPDVNQDAAALALAGARGVTATATMSSNMNFPAPLAVLGFLGICAALVLAIGAVLIFWLARKRRLAKYAGVSLGATAAVYIGLLLGLSAVSHDNVLGRGQEKYFCEIDCHLAYSIVNVSAKPDLGANDYIVTLRTRFDETTISTNRPKDALLTPSPREVQLIDSLGREYAPMGTSGTSLMTPLKPGESYTTQLEFVVPKDTPGLRLLLNTTPAWPDYFVIGDENSWGHKKTYLSL